MARWLVFLNTFLISLVFILPPLYARKKASAETEKDVEEIEALIEESEGPQPAGQQPAERKPAAKAKSPGKFEEAPSFYKSFGPGMSIRGDGKYFYIQAKDTLITVDAAGHVQIEAAENILMKSKKSITLQADEKINLISGEGVSQSKIKQVSEGPRPEGPKEKGESVRKPAAGEPAEAEEEGIVETKPEAATKEPAAQLPPKGEIAEEPVDVEKKVQEPESATTETEESESLEEGEAESARENE